MPDETNHPIVEIKQRETGKVLRTLSPESLRFADPHRIMLRPDVDLRGADLQQADLRIGPKALIRSSTELFW